MKSTIILASNNEKSFSKEIVNKLIDILTQNKVQYEVIDLYKDNFNPVMTAKQEQLYSKGETDDELVKKYQKHLKESDEITLQFFVGLVINVELPKNIYLAVTYT
mgnify:CR=1 FL=1